MFSISCFFLICLLLNLLHIVGLTFFFECCELFLDRFRLFWVVLDCFGFNLLCLQCFLNLCAGGSFEFACD